MKKLLFLPLIFCAFQINGQNVTFTGEGLSTIVAENVTNLQSVSLNAGDTLVLSPYDGVNDVYNDESSSIKIYPNPSADESKLVVIPPVEGDAVISIYDIAGSLKGQAKVYLDNFMQSFKLSGLGTGFYIISIKGVSYHLSGKLLSYGTRSGIVNIDPLNDGPITVIASQKKVSKNVTTSQDLGYSSGDIIKFTGTSGNNRTVVTDSPTGDKTIIFDFYDCTDADWNDYPVVQIGTQVWMAENLKTTKYANGVSIVDGTDSTAFASIDTAAYCWPNGDIGNKDAYGALYNWMAVNDTQDICPLGWHVATNDEWLVLVDYLGGREGSFLKLKETGTEHWYDPNFGTNSTGFTSKPNGLKDNTYKYFGSSSSARSYFWTSTEGSGLNGLMWWGGSDQYGWSTPGNVSKTYGFGVRCLRGVILPAVTTAEVSTTSSSMATVGGQVISDGNDVVTDRGVYWGTTQNPETSGTKVEIGSGVGVFATSISGLTANTTYYVRAYATNGVGTAFGNEVSFITPGPTPTLTTAEITEITTTTATGGGNITDDGGDEVIARGVCWSTSHNPTISGSKTVDGSGIGVYTSSITGLNDGTTYYVRAYATNSGITVYGDEISFTTELVHVSDTFYVSTTGNDSDPGTSDQPWKTIQKAANTMIKGDVVIVHPGIYNEYVTISKNGTSDIARLKFISDSLHKAKVYGFKVQGNYVTIDGFDVDAPVAYDYGILVNGKSYADILNCSVNECIKGGIHLAYNSSYARVIGNSCDHNGYWGIRINGHHNLVENNTISRVVQLHLKITTVPVFHGEDADGMRVFGEYNIIRGNTMLKICEPDDPANNRFGPGEGAHADCIQTWDYAANGDPVMANTIIEGNYFQISHPSGKGIIIDATRGDVCHDLIIRNNIFEFHDVGISASSGLFENIFVYNNVFKAKIGESSWGTALSFRNIANYAVINNITIDCHPEHRHIIDGSGVIQYNYIWNSDGSTPSLTPALQPSEVIGDPKFVNYTGNYGDSDYHLQSDSPCIDAGITISDVTEDLDNVTRPQGSAYDIGAYEYVGSK